MIFARLEASVSQDEGLKLKPYLDTEKVWTIGRGTTFIGDRPVTESTPAISEAFADQLLRAELFDACLGAQKFCPNFSALSDIRQEVVVEMCYQLGYQRLSQFNHFREALMREDWAGAAAEMRNSAWDRETHNRAEHLATLMEAG